MDSALLKVTSSKFAQLRNASWEANAELWFEKLPDDPFRSAAFDAVLTAIREWFGPDQTFSIADVGCGDGSFLELVHMQFPKAQLIGMDVCKSFIRVDRRRLPAANFISMDIERPLRHHPLSVNVITAILSMIEVSDLRRSFANITALLAPRGRLAIVVLDSGSERRRHLAGERDKARSMLFTVGEEVVISSYFTVGKRRSVCPYYRFLREPTRYVEALQSVGLNVLRQAPFDSSRPGGSEPLGVLIEAEKR